MAPEARTACLKLKSLSTTAVPAETGPQAELGRPGAAVEDHPFEETEEMAAVDPVEGIAEREAPLLHPGGFRGGKVFRPGRRDGKPVMVMGKREGDGVVLQVGVDGFLEGLS